MQVLLHSASVQVSVASVLVFINQNLSCIKRIHLNR